MSCITVETNIGNFGSFEDLHTCMVSEGFGTVDISSVRTDPHWGSIEFFPSFLKKSCGTVFTLADVEREIREEKRMTQKIEQDFLLEF